MALINPPKGTKISVTKGAMEEICRDDSVLRRIEMARARFRESDAGRKEKLDKQIKDLRVNELGPAKLLLFRQRKRVEQIERRIRILTEKLRERPAPEAKFDRQVRRRKFQLIKVLRAAEMIRMAKAKQKGQPQPEVVELSANDMNADVVGVIHSAEAPASWDETKNVT